MSDRHISLMTGENFQHPAIERPDLGEYSALGKLRPKGNHVIGNPLVVGMVSALSTRPSIS